MIQRGVELRLAIAREFERLKSEQVPTNRPVTDDRQTEARLVHAEQTLAKYFGGATEVTILLDVDSVNPPPTVVKQAEGYIKTTYL